MPPVHDKGFIYKKLWTVPIRPVRGNQGDDRGGVIKAEHEGHGWTFIHLRYDEEPSLQSRRHKFGYNIVIEGKFGGY